ncbi:hypothetical protein AB0K12_02500 [Nonomuraea sp. NPDC049419]|uniref:hypothetical protein n=1 Tax=Nonomuraea sp. NPDC049419 TaxID=3155772 RepID=UPI003436B9FC
MAALLLILALPVLLALSAIRFAARSAPAHRPYHMYKEPLLNGATTAAAGLVILLGAAWMTHHDGHHDDFGSAMTELVGMFAGGLLLRGAAPFLTWILATLDRRTPRFPPILRPATRQLGGGLARTSAGVAAAMTLTGIATAVLIVAPAVESQDRAGYRPQGRLDATTINVSAGQQASSVRAVIEQELPGVPLLPADTDDLFSSVIELDFAPDTYVGDETLLHHLTGNPATPYDPATAVLVSSEVKGETSALIQYDLPSPGTTMDLRVIAVPPPQPRWEVMFVPEEAARERGITLTPDRFIIDPSHHRLSPAEQERLQSRLAGLATVHVERGFHPTTTWTYAVAALFLIAAAATVWASRSSAASRILRRGSADSPRLLMATRTLTTSLCATAMGAVTGAVIGLLLLWPATTSSAWDPPPRAPFNTPWPTITALLLALPVLTAATAALIPLTPWFTRTARTSLRL